MRILVVSDLPQFVTGGAEMQAARLIESWLDAGHEVICVGRRMGPGPVLLGRHKIDVARIRVASSLGRWGRAASYALSLGWLLLRRRRWADVVYTRFFGEAAITAALLKLIGLLPVVLVATPANTRGDGDAHKLRQLPLGELVVRLLDRQVDAINLIAKDMAPELQASGFSGRNFSYIPNGIPVTPVTGRQPARPLVFLAVGRLSPQKGYDVLLEAIAQLNTPLTTGQFRIIGDGPERGNLHAMATRLGIADTIEWLGEQPQDQVKRHLVEADVFLLPSRYEGMSNAALEAMERALPIVTSRCGGIDHYVTDEIGWVVCPEDKQELAKALDQVLNTHADRVISMGTAARRCVVENFDMAVIGARYLELFKKLHDQSGSGTVAG